MKSYYVRYEIDSGYDYVKDVALVFAENEGDARKKINKHVNALGNEYMISEIFSVSEFNGEVFTGKYGWS